MKRIAGLPGERIAIDSAGTVHVNDLPLRPSLSRAWEQGIEVYTTADLGTDPLAHRFHPLASSAWTWIGSSWVAAPAIDPDPEGWLIYEHRNVYWDLHPDVIRDDDPANIGERRELKALEEPGLQLEITLDGPAAAELDVAFAEVPPILLGRLRCPPGKKTIRILRRDGSLFWIEPLSAMTSSLNAGASPPWQRLENLESPPQISPEKPLAMRIISAETTACTRIELRRSVRYDPPASLASRWREGVLLGPHEFMVLGDNGPASIDSRSTGRGVPREQIRGRVTRATDARGMVNRTGTGSSLN